MGGLLCLSLPYAGESVMNILALFVNSLGLKSLLYREFQIVAF